MSMPTLPSAVTMAASIATLRSEIPELSEETFPPNRYSDEYILRFLQGKKFKLNEAKAFLQTHALWIKKMEISTLMMTEFPEQEKVKLLYPAGYHGVDFQNRPIYIERVGELRVNEILQVISMDRLLSIFVKEYEKTLWQRMPAAGGKQSFSIIDISGVSFGSFKKEVRNFLSAIIGVTGQNYPELLGVMYIINAPFIFQGIWSVIKPLIDPNTRRKIHIVGKNYRDYFKPHLDVDALPVFLGGKCKCDPSMSASDLHGCLLSDIGPWNRQAPSLPAEMPSPHNVEDFVSVLDVDDFQTCPSVDGDPVHVDVVAASKSKSSFRWCLCT
jgi:hypothetical protein